jgi:hypothetical protein
VVSWAKLTDAKTGRVLLAYGDCHTNHISQGANADEHIAVFPHGSKAIDAGAGYVASTRHRNTSYVLTSALAEYVDVKASRPRNDVREVTDDDRWANVAGHLIARPQKDLATDLSSRTGGLRRGSVREFHDALQSAEHRKSLGQTPSDGPDLRQRVQVDRMPGRDRAMEMVHAMGHAVAEYAQSIQAAISQRVQQHMHRHRGHEREM